MTMLALMWGTLLSLSGCGVDADEPALRIHCDGSGFCVKMRREEISAEAGLCAVIPCSFYTPVSFTATRVIWYKCDPSRKCYDSEIIFHSKNPDKVQSRWSGRVSLLDPDLSHRNCSIFISDLELTDSGSYQIQINSDGDRWRFNPRSTLTVEALQKPSVDTPALTEGQPASVSCTAPVVSCGPEPNITWSPPTSTTSANHSHRHISISTSTNQNEGHSSTLLLTPSADLHGAELTCTVRFGNISTERTVRLNVTYVRDIVLSGDTVVTEEHTVNVTCSVDSFPPSRVVWFGLNKTSLSQSSIQTDLGSASLVIYNVTQEHQGRYFCEAQHLDSTYSRELQLSVMWRPQILSSSGCELQAEVLTCVCVTQGSPVPSVTWSLHNHTHSAVITATTHTYSAVTTVTGHTDYTVVTTVTGHTVNSSISLRVKDHNTTVVQCVSSNRVGQVQERFRPTVQPDTEDPAGPVCQRVSVTHVTVTVVSLILNIIFIVFILVLWNWRKRPKPDAEEQVYVPLQKTDPSEYEVIQRPISNQL